MEALSTGRKREVMDDFKEGYYAKVVRVMSNWKTGEGSEEIVWVPLMDMALGKVQRVDVVNSAYITLADGYAYPREALEKIEEPVFDDPEPTGEQCELLKRMTARIGADDFPEFAKHPGRCINCGAELSGVSVLSTIPRIEEVLARMEQEIAQLRAAITMVFDEVKRLGLRGDE